MSNDVTYWHLRNHKLFSSLSNNQITDLCIITRFKKAKKGDVIYFAHESVQRVFFLKKGRIKIVEVDLNGNEHIKDIIQQGDIFGEITLSNTENTREYAQAFDADVVICSFKSEDFEKLLEKDPILGLSYYKLVGFKLKKLQSRYSDLMYLDVRSRLYTFLLEWCKREGIENNGDLVISNYLTHQDIAHLICSTRQTTTQLMNELEEQGIVHYSRKEIRILKPQNLQDLLASK